MLAILNHLLIEKLKLNVLYGVTCNECSSIDVGQTSNVTNRFSEHQRKGSHIRKHIIACCDTAQNIEQILDAYRGVKRLMTTEAIYIKS